jgi:hypothetical protein
MRINLSHSNLNSRSAIRLVTLRAEPAATAAGTEEDGVNSSFDEGLGSAVMRTATVIVDLDWLLDELELRLTRCVYDAPTVTMGCRNGPTPVAGESLHRAAEAETQAWWEEHRLADADERVHLKVLSVLLERSPQFLAWSAVPLLTRHLTYPVDSDFVDRLIEWVTAPLAADRMVRDGIALSILAPWLQQHGVTEVTSKFRAWSRSNDGPRVRLALTAMAAYVHNVNVIAPEVVDCALGVCWSLAPEIEPDTAMSVGWLMRELLQRDRARVLPQLSTRIHEFSRQAMRTAVERLPAASRSQLTSNWQAKRYRRWNPLRSTGTRQIRTRRGK